MAWSQETEPAAKVIRERLARSGLSPWMSVQISPGRRFREEIRRHIRNADLVIAVFPQEPSRWLTAEAGLAHFEEKLLPVAIDREGVVEPFDDLQVHTLASADIDAGDGPSIDSLIELVKARLGYAPEKPLLVAFCRFGNGLFFAGVPIAGAALVCTLLVAALLRYRDDRDWHLWTAGHTVIGAIVYGGAAFITLIFSRASISPSLAERQFGFATARRLFFIWLFVAASQLLIGLYLVNISPYEIGDSWVVSAVLLYMLALVFWFLGFDFHRTANNTGEEDRSRGVADLYAFLGNASFGCVLVLLTVVIVLMSLKEAAMTILGL